MMKCKENIVVFGGTSFIGRHLCDALSRQCSNVISVNNPSSKKKCSASSYNVEVDVCNPERYTESLQKVVDLCAKKIDCVYVASWAGTNDRGNEVLNKKSAEGLFFCMDYLMKMCECKRIIQLGSQAEYGRGERIVNELTTCNPLTAYGRQKLRFSEMMFSKCIGSETAFIEFRIHSVYGKGRGGLIEWLINQLSENKDVYMETTCKQIFDYLYIDDCVAALLLGKNELKQGIYNISSGKEFSLREYCEIVRDVVNPKSKIIFGNTEELTGPDFVFDSNKLRNQTAWIPKVSFKDGIKMMRANIS